MSKVDEVLVGVTSLGFDTAPLIYFVERHPAYVDIVREFVQRVDRGAVLGYSSVVTLTEVLTQPKQKGNTTVEQEYRDLLLHPLLKRTRELRVLVLDDLKNLG